MNEEDILLLEQNGYNVNRYGVITSNNNYISEATVNGKTYKSLMNESDYKDYLGSEEILQNSGYHYDETLDESEGIQRTKALKKAGYANAVKTVKEGGAVNLPDGFVEDPLFQEAYNEENSEDGYEMQSPEAAAEATEIQMNDNNPVLAQFDDEEQKKAYIKNQNELGVLEYLTKGGDTKTKLKDYKNQDMWSYSLFSAGGTSIIPNPGEDAGIIEKGLFRTSKIVSDLWAGIQGTLTPTGIGIDDEDYKSKWIELKQEERKLKEPIATKNLGFVNKQMEANDELIKARTENKQALQEKIKALQSIDYKQRTVQQNEELGTLLKEMISYQEGNDDDITLMRNKMELQYSQTALQSYLDGDEIDRNILSNKFLLSAFTGSMADVAMGIDIDLDIQDKLDNGEPLTPAEELSLQQRELTSTIEGAGLEQNFWYDVTGGTAHSFSYLGAGIAGRGVAKVATQQIASSMIRKGVPMWAARTLSVAGNIGVQTALHGETYNASLDKWVGDVKIEMGVDGKPIYLTRDKLYNSEKEKNRLDLADIEEQLAFSQDEFEKLELNQARDQILKYDGRLRKPATWYGAGAHGTWENIKEIGSETLGGAILGKLGQGTGWIGRKAIDNRLGRAITQSKKGIAIKRAVQNSEEFINKLSSKVGFSQAMKEFNRLNSTIGGYNLIGGQGEEMFEEVLVQVLPTVGQNWEEYWEQASEVLDVDFYLKVGAQTALMRGGTSLFGAASERVTRYSGLTKEQKAEKRKAREEFGKVIKELSRRGVTQKEFDEVFKSIGEGTYSMTEFTNSIREAEQAGNMVQAVKMKVNFAQKQVQAAQANGKLGEFTKALKKAKGNTKLDAGTREQIGYLIAEAEAIQSDDRNYINSTQVIDWKSKKKYTDRAIDDTRMALDEQVLHNHRNAAYELNKALGIPQEEEITIEEALDSPKYAGQLAEAIEKGTIPESAKNILILKSQQRALENSSKRLQKEIDHLTSFEKQTQLQDEQDYKEQLGSMVKKYFPKGVTSKQLKKALENHPNKQAIKTLGQDNYDKINSKLVEKLADNEKTVRENKLAFKAMKKKLIEQEEKRKRDEKLTEEERIQQEINEGTRNADGTLHVEVIEDDIDFVHESEQREYDIEIEEAVFDVLEKGAEHLSDIEDGRDVDGIKEDLTEKGNDGLDTDADINDVAWMPTSSGESLLSDSLMNGMSAYFTKFKAMNNGKEPTFEDFWNVALRVGKVDNESFTEQEIQMFGENWEAARLGKSGWENIWANQYKKYSLQMDDIFADINLGEKTEKTEAELKQENKETADKSVQGPEPGRAINTNTGEVKKVTPSLGKSAVTKTKAAFSAIAHEVRRTIMKVVDGKKTIKVNKESIIHVGTAPQLNTDSYLNIKALLHPDKNNPGDTWEVIVGNEESWDIPVAITDPKTFEVTYISFGEWIKRTRKEKAYKDMTDEQFMRTDAYIGKVPILYRDKEGNDVSVVPDVDSYNPMNIDDVTKEDGEYIDLDNPTEAQLKTIAEGKANTLALRKDIIEGRVSKVVIKSKSGSPTIELDPSQPAMPLSTAAPDAQIVYAKSGGFYDLKDIKLDGNKVVVLNPEIVSKLDAKGKKAGSNSAYYLNPVYKENGISYVQAFPVLRKNERNEPKAMDSDVTTAKLIVGAHNMLAYPDAKESKNGMSLSEAQTLKDLIERETGGFDITDPMIVNNLLQGLIALKVGEDKFVVGKDSKIPARKKNSRTGRWEMGTIGFNAALMAGSTIPVQNISFLPDAIGITISKGEEGFKVDVNEDYEGFIKDRLFTTNVSYNMDETGGNAYTSSIQPTIIVEAIQNDQPKTVQQLEKKEPKVKVNTKVESKSTKEVAESIVDNTLNQIGGVETQAEETTDPNALTVDEAQAVEDAYNFLRSVNGIDASESKADEMLEAGIKYKNIKASLEAMNGLTVTEQEVLTQFMLGFVTDIYDPKTSTSIKDFKFQVEGAFNKIYKDKLNEAKKHYETLRVIAENKVAEGMDYVLSDLLAVEDSLNTILNNVDTLFKRAYMQAKKSNFIPSKAKTVRELEEELEEDVEEAMYEKDFNKSSNEVIHKEKISTQLKKIFQNLPTGETSIMGTPIYENYDYIYNQVATFLCSPLPAEPSLDSMLERLGEIADSNKWASVMISRLKAAPDDIQHGFVSNMFKYEANAEFVMFLNDKKLGLEGELWFSNANNLKKRILDSWDNNFKRGKLTKGDNLDKAQLEKLVQEYESWGDDPSKQDKAVLRKWLEPFGLILSDGTWNDLIAGKLSVARANKPDEDLSFEELFFDEGKRSNRLFSNLLNFAKKNAAKTGVLDYTADNSDLNPLGDMNNILKGLVDLESKHSKKLAVMTRRDGGKTISEVVFPSHFLNTVNKLIKSASSEDKDYLKQLKDLPFSEDSYILDLLMNNPSMAGVFSYSETGNMSLRDKNKKIPNRGKVDQLSQVDYMFHQRAMFQYMNTTTFSTLYQRKWKMRNSTMSTPTNSDKGRMMMLKTPVFDFMATTGAFEVSDSGEVIFSDKLKELLFEQLVNPELKRIVGTSKKHNLKGYNEGAQRFNAMPGLNVIKNAAGQTALEFLKSSDKEGKELVAEFKKQFIKSATNHIQELTIGEATSNLKKMKDVDTKTDKLNNSAYVDSKRNTGSVVEKRMMAEMDYLLNGYIVNMNTMQLIAGDPALYYKSDANGTSSNLAEQEAASRDLGVNMGKRLALMIAPGIALSDSNNDPYIQLFMKDQFRVASNAEIIVGMHYGKEVLKEEFNGKTYKQHIEDLRKQTISKENLKQLNLKFAKVAAFLNIESTDAQEYTTLKEHLRVLVGIGKITQSKANYIYDRVYVEKKPLDKNDPDVQTVLQPMKPVYTGSIMEDGVNRIMYIKSSSFPLIPEFINGTELQPLMEKMNEIEKKSGKNVRASYQSANKVGAMANPIDPFSSDDLKSLDDLDDTDTPKRSMTLDRMGFKIQQEVPFKSDKTTEDKVSMGTQIFKLLFGDGISDIKEKDFDGKALQQEFFKTFSDMIKINGESLLDDLGLNEDFTPKDPLLASEKLEALLKAEAEERGFSENEINSLDLQSRNKGGETVYHFKLPLWFSGNSNKMESMLNAIIINRIFKQKLPGNAFVVGSETGITIEEQDTSYDKTKRTDNRTIFLGDYRGGELGSNEVLIPSKIKLRTKNGLKIVDLFEVDKKGNYIYIKEEGGGFVLNEEKIDPALFENFGFRTPTSSHGSASTIKIVGFIPAIMGDLLITPKGFIAQMGQDFDVDKLTVYQFHHLRDENGKVVKLDESHKERMLAGVREEIASIGRSTPKSEKGVLRSLEAVDFADSFLMALLYDGEKTEAELNAEALDILNLEVDDLESKLSQLSRKFDLKVAQNKFIEIHNKVYTNKSNTIQKKINKVLTMEVAEKQADAIEEANVNAGVAPFNLLSPTYQMGKMISGAIGTEAIGIYAKGTTFNSLAQQLDTKLHLIELDENDQPVNKKITIGRITSDGEFGRLKTLSVKDARINEIKLARSIAESQDERVNTATDNEKAQILGRVGITSLENVAIDNLLSLLGIDTEILELNAPIGVTGGTRDIGGRDTYDPSNKFHKKAIIDGKPVFYSQYSLSYLLSSQPIVKEYFERLKNSRSNTRDYEPNLEEKIFNELMGEYEITIQKVEKDRAKMTGKFLLADVQNGAIDTESQRSVLYLYKELMKDAKALKELQQVVDMSNLGKSMWELKDKIEKFEDLKNPEGSYNQSFSNPLSLMGEMVEGEFVPTTNQGVMVSTALDLGRNLFFKYFPYYDEAIEGLVDGIEEITEFKGNPIELKQEIFENIKKYITTNSRDKIFNIDASEARRYLFFTGEGSVSLSSYLGSGMIEDYKNSEFKEGLKVIQDNLFLQALNPTIGNQGKPDLIKFNNTEAANTSELDLHNSFKELIVSELPLPNKNGKPYTTTMLARELIAYSFLAGGIVREAIEFHRFIPIEYFEDLKFTATTNSGATVRMTALQKLQNYDTELSNWSTIKPLMYFTAQFFQNNPQYAVQLEEDIKRDFSTSGMVITTPLEDGYPMYVSERVATRSKFKQDKWKLYQRIGNGNTYQKIDVVGEFGMSEYDFGKPTVKTSIIKKKATKNSTTGQGKTITREEFYAQQEEKKKVKTNSQQSIVANESKTKEFSIEKGETVQKVLEKIAKGNFAYNPHLSELAQTMIKLFGDKALTIQLKVVNNLSGFRGNYYQGVITMNKGKKEFQAQTFLHEFIHSVTSDYIMKYVDKQGNVAPNAPKDIQELNEVFKAYKEGIIRDYADDYNIFKKKYQTYLKNKTLKPEEQVEVEFSEKELSVFYATVNLKEFIAIPLSNNVDLLEVANKMTYKDTSLTVAQKLGKVFQRIIDIIAGEKNTVGQDLVKTSLGILENQANTMKEGTVSQEVSMEEITDLVYENQSFYDNLNAEDYERMFNDDEMGDDINYDNIADFGDEMPAGAIIKPQPTQDFEIVNSGSELNYSEEKIKELYEDYKALMTSKRDGYELSERKYINYFNKGKVMKVGDSHFIGEWDNDNGVFKARVMSAPSKRAMIVSVKKALDKVNLYAALPSDMGKMANKLGMFEVQAERVLKGGRWEGMEKRLYFKNKALAEKVFGKKAEDITPADVKSYDNIEEFWSILKNIQKDFMEGNRFGIFKGLQKLKIYDYSAYKMVTKYGVFNDKKYRGKDGLENLDSATKNLQSELIRRSTNQTVNINYENPLDTIPGLYDLLDTELNKKLATYLSKFGINTVVLTETQDALGMDTNSHVNLLNKVVYLNENDLDDYPAMAGKMIAYMMQHNPLVTEIIKGLTNTNKVLGGQHKFKDMSKGEMFEVIGELIGEQLHKKVNKTVPKSITDKVKKLITDFFSMVNSLAMKRINRNVGIIADQIVFDNQAMITANPFKPGADGKEVSPVSFEEALKTDSFGKDIIEKLQDHFLLAGSTAIAEQGLVLRPSENPLHDIDWTSGLLREEGVEIFEKTFPKNHYVRNIQNTEDGYQTDTWLIAPEGYTIINIEKTEKDGKVKIEGYDIIDDSTGEKVSAYYGKGKMDTHVSSIWSDDNTVTKVIEGKTIDIFSGLKGQYQKIEKETVTLSDGSKYNVAGWRSVFRAKMKYGRLKDIWDYNRFIPFKEYQHLKEIPDCI